MRVKKCVAYKEETEETPKTDDVPEGKKHKSTEFET